MNKAMPPIVFATELNLVLDGSGDVTNVIGTVMCPFCNKKHHHGLGPFMEGGFRTSHCKGPDDTNDYYVAVIPGSGALVESIITRVR